MLATKAYDIKDVVTKAVYDNWQEGNITSTVIDTSQKWTPPSTQMNNAPIIVRVAREWDSFIGQLWATTPNFLPSSLFDVSIDRICQLPLTKDIVIFCNERGIQGECNKYYKLFIETFNNIQDIAVRLSDDYEISDYQKISFVITVKDNIENVLKYENDFRKKLREEISPEKRHHFTYNYNLI